MTQYQVIVVGGGISGLSLAHYCRAQGRATCLLEREERVGGALHSARFGKDFWLELGAHTGYNSYSRLLNIVEVLGLASRLTHRETARWMLWRGGHVQSVLSRLNWLELAVSMPRMFTAIRTGKSVEAYYSRVLGKRNFEQVVRPMLSAVVSQDAATIPAELLFKKRPRRKEHPRSFAFWGGLQSIPEAIADQRQLTVLRGVGAERIVRDNTTWRVTTSDGQTLEAPALAIATGPDVGARLLAEAAPDVATLLGRIGMATLETEGVVVRSARTHLPRLAGLVGVEAPFWSVVARDPVRHRDYRGFAFHFRPGTPPEERTARICAVLGIQPQSIEERVSVTRSLPAPDHTHAEVIRHLYERLADVRLLVTGNYFGGLAIEDCVARSAAEVERLLSLD
ncbi:MAG TPA: FAD-dependent oxidoreductase [bacterium]|nr:FAD-dependent oxidoreductase [bacterium]